MRSRSLPALLLLAATSTAAAQAPGEVAVVPVAPAYPPTYAPALYVPEVAPMRDRISIGLSVGGLSLSSGGSDDTLDFSVAELALRYRVTPRFELELTTFGGRQTIYDEYSETSSDGELATGSLAVGARYRFRPDRRVGWWVMGAIGGVVVAPHDAGEDEVSDSTRGMAMIGLGGEWRFARHWGLQSELRLVSVGSSTDDELVWDDDTRTTAADGTGGATFTLGANFYF